ncbi:MAG: CDP-alcohol phosphatidyltransferase family protein [Porticoccaceae bacterium]|nr:CDP-alcohol phosphatidyltransferase family protein [Porticoccaceae bacterium]
MATIYDLKPRFQALLRPIVRTLAQRGVSANQVTVFALIISLLLGALLALAPQISWLWLLLPVWLLLRMALNAIDGMLAREHNMKSHLGAILNELGDVLADAALYLPFALLAEVNGTLVVLVVLLAVISEMAGVVAIQVGSQRRYDGPMGKSDRAFLFGVAGLLIGLGVAANIWLNAILCISLGLLLATIIKRNRNALKESA